MCVSRRSGFCRVFGKNLASRLGLCCVRRCVSRIHILKNNYDHGTCRRVRPPRCGESELSLTTGIQHHAGRFGGSSIPTSCNRRACTLYTESITTGNRTSIFAFEPLRALRPRPRRAGLAALFTLGERSPMANATGPTSSTRHQHRHRPAPPLHGSRPSTVRAHSRARQSTVRAGLPPSPSRRGATQ